MMRKAKGGSGSGRSNGLFPNSFRIISSCLKTVSTNASSVASTVRSAGASVAASIASEDQKDQVLWAGFDKLELGQFVLKHVLLLGYTNGFQVLDVEDVSNVNELVSKRDGPVTFLQMQPTPAKSEGEEGFIASQPVLLVVAGDETVSSGPVQGGGHFGGQIRDGNIEPQPGNSVYSPTAVRFYSLRTHSYVHVLRFRSAVYTVRCSPRIVAVGLATQVVIKDFESRAVISQFRAHSSPISALCFDPSGTLLVTASVYGNNINIFRIMPSCILTGSGTPSYDWSSSHVHLYKLYRGMTTAVIQDICFSHYSQWIAIVSSRGTCHIFVLSPFGGDAGLQLQGAHNDGPILSPGLSLPWWSASSCTMNQHAFPPPPPVTLSVVSRIKDGNSGWLNTVSNAAASATGKVFVPSGAVAAVFHNSVSRISQNSSSKALEHLLVYTPSGHLIQHELLPSLGIEPNDNGPRTGSVSFVQVQDEELKVRVEPVQWWDVCRRSDWPEREVHISQITHDTQEAAQIVMDNSAGDDINMNHVVDSNNSSGVKGLVKPCERPHWYLSNAEVQIYTGRIAIWQKSKISFHMMIPLRSNERKLTDDNVGGEIEIEKVPVHELEIRHKDLLPVFDHFHSVQPDWGDRGLFVERSASVSSSDPHRTEGKLMEVNSYNSKSASLGSGGSSNGGSSRATESLLDLDQTNMLKSYASMNQSVNEIDVERESKTQASTLVSQCSSEQDHEPVLPKYSTKGDCKVEDHVVNDVSSSRSNTLCVGKPPVSEPVPSINAGGVNEIINTSGISEMTNASSEHSGSSPNIRAEDPTRAELQDPLDFGQYFQEGYCKVTERTGYPELTDINDADSSSSHCERERPEEEAENDDMLGGVFAFSEES
ncbi:autophagy-related protein 18g-like isoform X3 [Macadamia integrifolia]|uniref:autophagy-related protein 18g-like isoform X3 n=1 Tax=Macadamia integrifolia TaxID=60698 RepID=UPI001C4FBBA6|nr:autophagy-related protein 18g-like isoform X3 [Macadamia integrifolia]